MIKALRASALLLACLSLGCVTTLDTTAALATVPYHVDRDGRIVIAASVNDNGPHRFAIDTAASRSVMYEQLRDHLGLEIQRDVMVQGMVKAGLFPLTRVRRIDIGTTGWEQVDLVVLPGDVLTAANHDGILGLDFLRSFTIVFDTERQLVSLFDPGDVAESHYQGWMSVPLHERTVSNSGRTFYFVRLRIANDYIPAVFDLGAGFNVLNWPAAGLIDLTPKTLRRNQADEIVGALGSTKDVFRVGIDEIATGMMVWRNEPFVIGDLPVFSALVDPSRPSAILGADLFLRRNLVIDFTHSRLLVDRR
ncbi:MAG: retroviral-like aspartic protease family protein, partial [Gammaproteobacteria bacterium]|nr:retroviral-like aspartic protease family protein [Gammaproteobacteria bacterium]